MSKENQHDMATSTIKEVEELRAPPVGLREKSPSLSRRGKSSKGPARPKPTPAPPDDDEEELPAAAAAPAEPEGEQDFFQKMTNFSTEEWSNMILYLFRTAPITDRRAAGKDLNIQKYHHPIDPERVMLDHGSGSYRVDWIRSINSRSVRIGQHYFQILNMDYPPKVPLGEWIDDPRNADWLWAKPGIAAAQAVTTGPNGQTIIMPNNSNTPENFFKQMKDFREAVGDSSKEGATVAEKAIEGMMQLTRENRELVNRAPAKDDKLLDMLMEDRRSQREEIAALRNMILNKPAEKSLVQQLAELQPLIKLIKPNAAAAVATEESGILGVVSKLADHIPEVLNMIAMSRGGSASGPGATPGPPTLPPLAPPPATQTQPGSETPAPEGFTDEQKKALQEMNRRMSAVWTAYGKLIEQCGQFMVDQFSRGLTGYDFRDWFWEAWGKNNWNNLRRDAGPEVLTALTQQHPQLKVVLTPPERVLHFFIEFFTVEGKEDMGQETMPPASDDDTNSDGKAAE
jgi:hypothetical protein